MSLNYDLTAIPQEFWHADHASEEAKQVTNALIWATVAVGIGTITEANWEEFAERVTAYEQAGGPFWQFVKDGEIAARLITPEEVRQRIGLKTNVFPKETKAAFGKKLARLAADSR